ncbi:MAG: ferrochelatase [Vicinamibacterales bacterium]
MPRRHVVLVTYGEPPTPSFVDQLTYSWRILLGLTRKVDAIPRPLLPVIALARARGRRQMWREHAYASPLEAITARQAARLAPLLAEAEPLPDWQVHVAYEYRQPLVGTLLASLPEDEPAWVIPLYAADSAFTHELTREAAAARGGRTYVLNALSASVLGSLAADHILSLTDARPGWQGPDVALVLAAHGTVLDPPTPIATGREATEALFERIRALVGHRFGHVANGWLNHTRGGRWTEPPVDRALADVAASGFRRVVYFPFGFLADNAESELEGRLALAQASLDAWHLPCLNEAEPLLATFARQVVACSVACQPGTGEDASGESSSCARLCRSDESPGAACGLCAPPEPPVVAAALTSAGG